MRKTIISLSLLGLLCSPALADDTEGKGGHMHQWTEAMFKQIDTNGDGYISRDEHEAFAKKMFDEADTNHDGKLSMEEFSAAKKREHDMMKAQMHGAHGNNTDGNATTGNMTNESR